DNYSMGLNAGRSVILDSDSSSKIAVLMENHQRNSVKERFDGFMDSLKFYGYTIELWERENMDTDLTDFIQDKMEESNADIIVALDDNTLEAVFDALNTNDTVVD